MTKTEEVKIETIDNQTKVGEKIETIYPETIETPTYDYWNSQNTLDYNVALRNKPTWWSHYKVLTWNYTANYTWIITETLDFTPKLIEFTFFPNTTWSTWSDWQIDSIQKSCLARKYEFTTNIIQQEFRPTDSFFIQEFVSSSVCNGVVNIIQNWFTIQAASNTFSIDLKWIAKCFW